MAKNTNEVPFGAVVFGFGVVSIGLVVMISAMVATTAAIEGWVLTKLWEWFVVLQFGLAPLTLYVAIGLSLIIGLLTNHGNLTKVPGEEPSWAKMICHIFVRPFIVLGIGAVIKFWLM